MTKKTEPIAAHSSKSGVSRRRFLGLMAGAGAAMAGAGALSYASMTDSQALSGTLPVPDLLDATTESGVNVFALTAQTGSREVRSGTTSSTYGFNGSWLAPTIKVTNGTNVRMDVTNRLGEDLSVHWHGAHVPPKVDGGVQGAFSDGETWQAAFTVNQAATTLWYHPHTMGMTAKQVAMGAAGMLIVTDDSATSSALPSDYGVDDIPLIFQSVPVDSDGAIKYDLAGFLAATDAEFPILVNGTSVEDGNTLTFTPTTTRVRFRLLNASLSDIFTISRSDGGQLTQVATDGGYLTSALAVDEIRLVAGSRAEIVMDISDAVTLQAVVEAGWILGGSGTYEFLSITPGGSDSPAALPATLNTIERYDTSAADNTRTIQLTQTGLDMSINGVVGTTMEAMEGNIIEVKKDALEVWTIENTTQLEHSFHVHDVPFQIISINGQDPTGAELGWIDTVEVIGAGTVVIAVKFTDYADDTNYYMLHCHIAQHEDEGMMTYLKVTDSS